MTAPPGAHARLVFSSGPRTAGPRGAQAAGSLGGRAGHGSACHCVPTPREKELPECLMSAAVSSSAMAHRGVKQAGLQTTTLTEARPLPLMRMHFSSQHLSRDAQ